MTRPPNAKATSIVTNECVSSSPSRPPVRALPVDADAAGQIQQSDPAATPVEPYVRLIIPALFSSPPVSSELACPVLRPDPMWMRKQRMLLGNLGTSTCKW